MIRKIGNSEGVIPKEVLNKLGLKNGDSLNLLEADGTIQLVPQSADLTDQLRAALAK
jgi:AbrB family looped-hinge helix DNA binding protein